MAKKKSIKSLKNRAWKYMSLWVRRSNANEYGIVNCFTCGSQHMWKDIQGGHFIHGHYKQTFLEQDNVHPQCVQCNKWKSGNLDVYAERLRLKIGDDMMEELRALSKDQWKPSREYYEEKISYYKGLVNSLDERTLA